MDSFSEKILKEIMPAEKEVAPRPSAPRNPVDHWSTALLMERAEYLSKLAKHGNGSAGETLKEYPQHSAVLSFRCRNGEAEVHENFADLFIVVGGRAALVTNGKVVDAANVKPGEIRGTAIEGGTRQEMHPGDVVHVPAGVSHQMLVAGDQTVTCLIMKIQEKQ